VRTLNRIGNWGFLPAQDKRWKGEELRRLRNWVRRKGDEMDYWLISIG